MKKQLLRWKAGILMSAITLMSICSVNGQNIVDFEDLELDDNSYWNGEKDVNGFISGDAFFAKTSPYSGIAYSNLTDMVTVGSDNQFSVYNSSGYNGSSNFAIVSPSVYDFPNVYIKSKNENTKMLVEGFYITNTTYTVLSMLNGDKFSKKFGGNSGSDKDSFVVAVKGYVDGKLTKDSVKFVLADYRFDNNEDDYIVDSWEWFDLSPLGYIDSVALYMYSSDNGDFGMNTPSYFAMDNFTIQQTATSVETKSNLQFAVYPNPVAANLSIDLTSLTSGSVEISILDIQGAEVMQTSTVSGGKLNLPMEDLMPGFYIVSVKQGDKVSSQRLIKQ